MAESLWWYLVHDYPNFPRTWKPIYKRFELDYIKESLSFFFWVIIVIHLSLYYLGYIDVINLIFLFVIIEHFISFQALEN